MAQLDELAHFGVGKRPVLLSVTGDEPLDV
jgi:hypothetical protein